MEYGHWRNFSAFWPLPWVSTSSVDPPRNLCGVYLSSLTLLLSLLHICLLLCGEHQSSPDANWSHWSPVHPFPASFYGRAARCCPPSFNFLTEIADIPGFAKFVWPSIPPTCLFFFLVLHVLKKEHDLHLPNRFWGYPCLVPRSSPSFSPLTLPPDVPPLTATLREVSRERTPSPLRQTPSNKSPLLSSLSHISRLFPLLSNQREKPSPLAPSKTLAPFLPRSSASFSGTQPLLPNFN